MDLSLISDLDIAMEHSKRENRREAEAIERSRIERIRYTGLIVDKIHEIDKTIPIVIYDQKKHADWKFKRSDDRFDKIVTPYQYGYMRRWNLCPYNVKQKDDLIPILAQSFIDRIFSADRYWGKMSNTENDFYFISKFEIGEYSRMGDEMSMVGYVMFNYEKRSNLIKELSSGE
jgi:hypothetical protein